MMHSLLEQTANARTLDSPRPHPSSAHSRGSGNPVYHRWSVLPPSRDEQKRFPSKHEEAFDAEDFGLFRRQDRSIITGAASGIGRAASMIFAREGANVVCADINAEGAKETADRLLTQGGKALALATDVTCVGEVNEMVRRSIETFGPVQFQFNSAGAALRPLEISRHR